MSAADNDSSATPSARLEPLRLKSPPHDGTISYTDIEETAQNSGNPIVIVTHEQSKTVAVVGAGGNCGGDDLREIMNQGKQDILRTQHKFNSSLTRPIVESESRVLESGAWLKQRKDVQMKYNVLPPIAQEKKVGSNHMSFYV